ncbi:MAG: MFS transporter [Cellulosilyticaceae bacterium]
MDIHQIIKKFSFAYIINIIGGAFFNNVYILFMSTLKGFTDQEISLVMGIIPLITVPAMLIWGRVLDRNKKLMGTAWLITLFNGICLGLMCVMPSFKLFFIIALVRTLVLQPMGSICEEYMINITKKAGIPYGKVRRFGTLGVGVVGLISPVVILFLGIKGMIFAGVVIVFLSAFLYRIQPEVRLEDQDECGQSPVSVGSRLDLLRNIQYWKVLGVIALSYGVLNSAGSYGNQMILLKMNCPQMIIVFLPTMLMGMEVLVLGISHKVRVEQLPYRAMFIGIILMCVRWTMLAAAPHYIWVIISSLLNGVIVGITLPAQNYLIAQVVPERQRSTAYLVSIVAQVSVVPGILNLMIGGLLPRVGISIFGILYLLVSLVALFFVIPLTRKEQTCKEYKNGSY